MGVIYRDISREDLLSFMDKSNIEYNIPRGTYNFIFNNPSEAKFAVKKINMEILDDLYEEKFPNVKNTLANTITPSLVYDEGWRLKITTDSVINALLYNFGSCRRVKDYQGKFSNNKSDNTKKIVRELGDIENRLYTADTYRLRDSLSYELLNSFKDKGKDFINLREEASGFIRTTRYLLGDNVFDDISVDVDKQISDEYLPKNLLYTLAISSLLKLEKFKDSDYSLLPNTYYERISKVGSSPYAKAAWFNKQKYFGYLDYNMLYEKIKTNSPELLETNKDVLDNIDILFDKFIFIKDGEGYAREKISVVTQSKTSMETEDYKKLKDKINFFENTDYKHKMFGIDTLDGYIGYVYDNNYIVFERFYRDKGYSKPARDEAIYVMPADKLLLSLTDKQAIMEYIKDNRDAGVKRIVHRGESYKERVQEVINSQDISTESFDSIHDRMKKHGKILIKK